MLYFHRIMTEKSLSHSEVRKALYHFQSSVFNRQPTRTPSLPPAPCSRI